jgi:hypothetical protein
MTNIVIRVKVRVGVMVFTDTFNNISVLSVEETGVTSTDLQQVSCKLYHIM